MSLFRIFKFLKISIFSSVMIFNELEAVEFQLKLKSGWQLIGLPTDIRASEAFNNDNVRLVWYYNGKTAKWEGYSPEKELKTNIEERRLDPIYFIERWQGLWVYSKVDWSLIIDETETPTTSSLDISNIKLYKGWNLISLPFDAVYSQKLFDGYKLWRYNSLNSNWQTNQKYEVLSFPEVDEVNSKDGYWVYSPEDREIDLSMVGGKLSTYKADAISETIGTFKTISEVETYIKKASLVGNREKKYWNWTEVIDDYTASNLTSSSTSSSSTSQTSNISNSIVNQTGLPSKYTGVEQANLLKEKNRIIYYKSGNQSISAIAVDDMLYSQNKTPMAFSISFAKGTSSIREFFTAGNKLIVISDLNDFDSNSSFANQCRANKTAISVYDINSQPIGFSNEKHVFIDGSAVEARMIDSSLYLVSTFQPCIEITYPKEWVSNSDPCNYPEDSNDYRIKCYDVEKDTATKKLFRYNYENPSIKNSYSLPKYQIGGTVNFIDLIDPSRFLASSKLDVNSSITTIAQIDTVSGKLSRTESIFGEYKNLSFGKNSLYFSGESAPHHLSFQETKKRSEVHKLSFFPMIEYRATGYIDGEIDNKFWLDELDGYLRVASRNGYSFDVKNDEKENSGALYVLNEENSEMATVGKVGELVESLYSLSGIKFYGKLAIASPNSNNRGFQILDLSSQTAPKKSGIIDLGVDSELIKYSSADNKLFSVGRYIEESGSAGGIKFQLFDMKDLTKPAKKYQKVFGDYYNKTHSFLNIEALAYDTSNGILALPIYSEGGATNLTTQTGLYLYNIDGNFTVAKNSQTNGFSSLGTISRASTDQRSLFFNESDGKTHLVFLNNGKISSIRVK